MNIMDCPYKQAQKGETRVRGFAGVVVEDAQPKNPLPVEGPQGRVLPTDAAARKAIPVCSGVLDYWPSAIVALAQLSKIGNDQHNPGQPLHHSRGKSSDHADTIARHLMERGTIDTDKVRHSAKVAWRALALLQEELEREEGAPLPRGSRVPV